MQKILSFNTIFQGVDIILHKNNEVIFSKNYQSDKQSEILVSSLEDVLNQNNLSYIDIDIFSTIIGPGNFTSIKTSLSVLKMIKLATNKKIITNNVFEIISYDKKVDIIILDMNSMKYFIEDKVNNKFYTIFKKDIEIFLSDKNNLKIITNDKNLLGIRKNIILSEFDNNKWIDSILYKNYNNIFNNDIEPLYIEEANITKRKN